MTGGRRWGLVFCLAFLVIVATHLVGLATSPPGLHTDEASIGYNAWTIAHYGTDQFGTAWPLLFRDFGDYKGPISTYLLAPLTLLGPLTPTLTRLPSAFAGIALAVAAALLAWRITRSRGVALIIMLEAAFEPWFFHAARINLEAKDLTDMAAVYELPPAILDRVRGGLSTCCPG
jgi:4-amino-4-deoxy-L-arabinose transferase-like glycosyltransferase